MLRSKLSARVLSPIRFEEKKKSCARHNAFTKAQKGNITNHTTHYIPYMHKPTTLLTKNLHILAYDVCQSRIALNWNERTHTIFVYNYKRKKKQ